MSGPDIQECGRIAGAIAVDMFEEFWAKTRHRYNSSTFELLGSDEAGQFGNYGTDGVFRTLPEDDPYVTILRRESDGQAFEIEIEVTARPLEAAPTEAQSEIPGQMALTEGGAA